jgi:hypothetical protein
VLLLSTKLVKRRLLLNFIRMSTWKSFSLLFAVLLTAAFSCLPGKKPTKGKRSLASDRTLTVTLNRFWGGFPTCELVRKNGQDQLTSSYKVRDSLVMTSQPVEKIVADSIFFFAEKINFENVNVYGTADARTGMKAFVTLKKGPSSRSIAFEKLKEAYELPADVLEVARRLNDISPEGFKLY